LNPGGLIYRTRLLLPSLIARWSNCSRRLLLTRAGRIHRTRLLLPIARVSFGYRLHIVQFHHFGWRRISSITIPFLHLWPVDLQLAIAEAMTRLIVVPNSDRIDWCTRGLLNVSSVGTRYIGSVAPVVFS
jgi:hypothetical protein